MTRIPVGIIGCGYWGPNLIRNFSACPLTEVVAICDANPARLEKVGRSYPGAKQVQSIDELLELPLQAVAIATPVFTHYSLGKRCLEAGMHVLIEKPLATTVQEARGLIDTAERAGRVLMVDHTYLFSPAVRKIKELIEHGCLGDLHYVDSVRINLGLFQHDVNVIWDLAPHDFSIVDAVLGQPARSISAWGCAHTDNGLENLAYVNVDYGDRLMATFHVNWLSPVKVRQMIFAGSRKSLIFNEMNATEPVKLYDKGIEVDENPEAANRLRIGYRTGDVWSPHIESGEPLQAAVTHFAECILERKPCESDGRLGMRVVQLLESATRSIRAQGGRIVLTNGNSNDGDSTRKGRHGQLHPDFPGRPVGAEGGVPLLR
jgi:predicted dehydrogenase